MSLDAFGRHSALGYAHAPLAARSGASTLVCSAWCPAPSRTDVQQHGQTRRPGSGRSGHFRLEPPCRLGTAALWATEQSGGRLGPAVLPWSLSEAPPKTPVPLPLRVQVQRNFFVGGSEELHDLRALALPDGFGGEDTITLNRHGLQTLSSGSVEVHVNTIVHQQQQAQLPTTSSTAGRAAAVAARSFNANNTLRAIASARTLGASESAADRVKRRLEERRSRERQPAASGPPAAPAAATADG